MRGLRTFFVVVVVSCSYLVFATPAQAAAPANDAIANATAITALPFADSVSTVDATTAADDPTCAGNGHTVWYALTLKRDMNITADTFGSNFDTSLSAYVGAPGSLTQIACNDDTNGLQSQITFPVTRRQTLYLMVGSFDGTSGGALTLSVNAASKTPRPHGAPANSARNRAVTGPLHGSAFYEFGINGCPFVYLQVDGTYAAKAGGTGTLHIAGCVDTANVSGGFEFVGSFVLVTPHGGTLSGPAQGTVFPLDLTLTVTSSTARTGPLRSVAGTIDFSANDITGAITGALTGSVRPASAKPTS